MPTLTTPPIFDGHNDVLSVLYQSSVYPDIAAFGQSMSSHLDRKKAKTGGFAGGFFAIWVPSPIDALTKQVLMSQLSYDLPLPSAIDTGSALGAALAQTGLLLRLEAAGWLTICTSVADIETAMAEGKLAAIMHMEGAEAIDRDFINLDIFCRAGLRSLGPVWSRPNHFGYGVPFRFPSSGDIGPGLTEDGIRLVHYCDQHRVLIDLSHLNEAGFWDVAKHSQKPLVATHSNANAISPHARNLTDRQLAAIAESDGMVGLNFAVAFLNEDGQMRADTSFDVMLRHLDHLITQLGEDRVGLGSDFDGTTVPEVIGNAAGLPALRAAMCDHGYDVALMEKLCYRNWLRVLGKIWID